MKVAMELHKKLEVKEQIIRGWQKSQGILRHVSYSIFVEVSFSKR